MLLDQVKHNLQEQREWVKTAKLPDEHLKVFSASSTPAQDSHPNMGLQAIQSAIPACTRPEDDDVSWELEESIRNAHQKSANLSQSRESDNYSPTVSPIVSNVSTKSFISPKPPIHVTVKPVGEKIEFKSDLQNLSQTSKNEKSMPTLHSDPSFSEQTSSFGMSPLVSKSETQVDMRFTPVLLQTSAHQTPVSALYTPRRRPHVHTVLEDVQDLKLELKHAFLQMSRAEFGTPQYGQWKSIA
jgi:hypothetical protein